MASGVGMIRPVFSALVLALLVHGLATAHTTAAAEPIQQMQKEYFNYGTWETGVMFSQGMSVRNPGRWLFLSGVGAEEDKPMGGVLHPGDFLAQCRYAWKEIKVRLERQGASLNDIVRTVTYVTDVRNIVANRTCRQEVFGAGPYPPQTFLVVSALARHGMLVEIEVTAIAAK